ncbi:glycosyltransferase [Xenophilus arseniciresistens]|uniref:Glycosyltransferase n=1 Tax=Xenophilus arseniciresistens TaxID=1283306 RepID=A0AAE3SXX8_9BURK|nr:glycosyltransferase [Xenophilus arseniciresistens]MDA7415487.1 glycosyltransferase [Xenophilus arseniciresistens]
MYKVAVLLASFNGEKWLEEQVSSILAQTKVEINLFLRDDCSSDGTRDVLNSLGHESRLHVLPNRGRATGTAAGNFFEIIKECADINVDYFFLADQDDYWYPEKISAAIELMRKEGADCYASNLRCVSDSQSPRILRKDFPQTTNDFLFQGASAGCTYGLSARSIKYVRNVINDSSTHRVNLAAVSHDWAIYAITRSRGCVWAIDPSYYIDYRQHNSNVYGALGFKSYVKRLRLLRSGWYRENVLNVAELCELNSSQKRIVEAIRRGGIIGKIRLLSDCFSFRRRRSEKIIMLFFIVVGFI